MEYRSLSVLAGLALAVIAGPISADEANWEARLSRAASMKAEAEQRQKLADDALAAQNLACQQKFQVNACIDKARKERNTITREVRQQQIDARNLEREVKHEQGEVNKARLAADAEQRARDLPVRQEQVSSERSAAEQRQQQKLSKKAAQAEIGAQRKAEKAAAHERKVAAHQAKVAERKARAEAKAARQQ